ncbi:hypothetical protein FACS189411_01670 [Bacteroidia bacterium]|nr:hypothetical protein FACS189411_01670 [Bacteroidia bacterium]
MARHCYASVVTLSQGVPLETVGELLGHTDWRATRIYAQVNNEKIGEDMRLENPTQIAPPLRFKLTHQS